MMNMTLQVEFNWADEVTTCTEEELALAKLIRRGAHKDLVQAKKTIEDLSSKLVVSDQRFLTLWKSFKSIAKLLWTLEDDGSSWGAFIPLIPQHLQVFVKRGVQACIKNVLAHVWVLDPNVPLEKFGEPTDDENYLESIERAEPEFEDLASHIAKKLEISILPSNDEDDS
jgi:hypothetical protein